VIPAPPLGHWWTVPILVLGAAQAALLEEIVVVAYLIPRLQRLALTAAAAVGVSALLRGDAAFAIELYHPIRGQVDSGEVRIIAVATPTRWPAIPNVPTLAEGGVSGIGYLGWYGLVFPAGTPKPIIDKLHKAMQQVLSKDAVKQRLEGIGAVANLSSPAEFTKVIQSDIKTFEEVAKTAGLEAK